MTYRAGGLLTLGCRMDKLPLVEETLDHPAFAGTVWALEPERHGVAVVGAGRGGPHDIVWEIHGHGPAKLLVCAYPPFVPAALLLLENAYS